MLDKCVLSILYYIQFKRTDTIIFYLRKEERTMKNFNAGKSTIIGQIEDGALFEKASAYVGEYAKGVFTIWGYLKTKSKTYNTDQYSLYVKLADRYFLLNVPAWYGSQLEEDFQNSTQTAEEYFSDASIKKIEMHDTKFNNQTASIEIYE